MGRECVSGPSTKGVEPKRSRKKVSYLDVHEVVHARAPQFGELQSALLQERGDIVSLLGLQNEHTRNVADRVSLSGARAWLGRRRGPMN